MTCTNCTNASTHSHWGGYTMTCVVCCARLVKSARPLVHLQKGHLQCMAMRPGRPSKDDALAALKTMDSNGQQRKL